MKRKIQFLAVTLGVLSIPAHLSLATEPEVASTHTGAGVELFNTETKRRK